MKKIILTLIIIMLSFTTCFAYENHQASTTILIYMVGSDLESVQGRATEDIIEMLSIDSNKNTNIIIQGGGTKKWKNSWLKDGQTGRIAIKDGKVTALLKPQKTRMTESDTLSEFINWGTKNYPADRYVLVFWDHGFGTMGGFAKDEVYDGKEMRLSDIRKGLIGGKTKFDVVLFDACLMGTLETAYALRDYAEYMVASEELMPACGMYYTTWLNGLEANPGISSQALSKLMVDVYTVHAGISSGAETTMSVIKPSYAEDIICNILAMSKEKYDLLIENARNSTVFGKREGGYDQYDLLEIIGFDEELLAAVKNMVVYCKNTDTVKNANGIAIYVPLEHKENYEAVHKDIAELIRLNSDMIRNLP